MSHIRLIGLLLFITAITLALAAAATRTTHVEVSSRWLLRPNVEPKQTGIESSTTIPSSGSTSADSTSAQPAADGQTAMPAIDPNAPPTPHIHDWDYAAHQSHVQTTAVPIAWPLLATAAAGLLLWFIQPPSRPRHGPKKPRKRASHRRRRR